MLSIEEARTRVARGAVLLDRKQPGWADVIDIGVLDLSRSSRCIAGQLSAGDWITNDAVISLCNDPGPYENGIMAASEDYQCLQDAWIEAIADRRLGQPASTNAVDPAVEIVESLHRAYDVPRRYSPA